MSEAVPLRRGGVHKGGTKFHYQGVFYNLVEPQKVVWAFFSLGSCPNLPYFLS